MTFTDQEQADLAELDVRVYTPPPAHFWLGVVGCLFFSTLTVAGAVLPFVNPDGSFRHPIAAAIVAVCVGGGFTLLSIYLSVSARRLRLYTSDVVVQQVGVFRCRAVAVAEVTEAVWCVLPKQGSLLLRTPTGKLVVHFGNYADFTALVQFFRTALPRQVQRRYDRFEAHYVPDSESFRYRQKRERRWSYASLGLALGLISLALSVPGWGWVRRSLGVLIAVSLEIGVTGLFSAYTARNADKKRESLAS